MKREAMGKGLCAIVLAVAVGSGCASAPLTHSFLDLPKYLDQGGTIYLTETTGPMATGKLETLSPTSMTILTGGNRRDVPEDRVAKIQRLARWGIGRGALLGLGVGFAAGVIAARSAEPDPSAAYGFIPSFGKLGPVLVGMLVGPLVGAFIGAVVEIRRTVYVAPMAIRLSSAFFDREGQPSSD
jgi:hypothetical protein